MLLTTVTKTSFLALLIFLLPATVSAGASFERLVTTVKSVSPKTLPLLEDLTAACGSDVLCAARLLAGIIGPKAILEKVRHPSSDRIRMVKSVKSIRRSSFNSNGVLKIELVRFGRKIIFELKKIAANASNNNKPIQRIELDLRQNPGGDVDRMLRVTAMFTGAVPDALHLIGRSGVQRVSVPQKDPLYKNISLRVLIGPKTKSSAEILAALLKKHGNASLKGARTFGKDYLLRVVPVSHDWRLLVPAERVVVPGIRLKGGLIPDTPLF